jgi:hypothetical protein
VTVTSEPGKGSVRLPGGAAGKVLALKATSVLARPAAPSPIWWARNLRRVLESYARYYNETRAHRSLDKDAPISRPVQRAGSIISHGLLGELHHHCVRV